MYDGSHPSFFREHRVRFQVLDWPLPRVHRGRNRRPGPAGKTVPSSIAPCSRKRVGQSRHAALTWAIGLRRIGNWQHQVGPFNYLGIKSSPPTPIEQRRLIVGLCMGNCDAASALSLSSLQQNHFFSDRIAGGASVGCFCKLDSLRGSRKFSQLTASRVRIFLASRTPRWREA